MKIRNAISVLKSPKGHFMTSRLNEEYFKNNNLLDHWNTLKENNLLTPESIYLHENPHLSPNCKCGKELHFLGYGKGFRSSVCFECSRQKKGKIKSKVKHDKPSPAPRIKIPQDIRDAIDFITRSNGTLDTRFLTKEHQEKHGLKKEIIPLLENNLLTPMQIYMFETGESDKCSNPECNDTRRFINYLRGFSEYCLPCSRKLNNWRNLEKERGLRVNPLHNTRIDLGISEEGTKNILESGTDDELLQYVKILINKLLLNSDGKLEGQRINEFWFSDRNLSTEYEIFEKLGIKSSKDLYDIENNDEYCSCGEKKRFIGYDEGYTQNCDRCSKTVFSYMKREYGDNVVDLDNIVDHVKDVNLKYNSTKMKLLSECTINKLIERTNYLENASTSERIYHVENSLFEPIYCEGCNEINDNYRFSNTGYHIYCVSCSDKFGSLEQEEVRSFVSGLIPDDVISNTYQILQNKEIDIYVPSKNICIEYDGLLYHSVGKIVNVYNKSEWSPEEERKFREMHIYKTEECEKQGLQLFHVFSSEWKEKQQIWKSVIRNALGESGRIHARKTTVREVPSKEARLFQDENHLQGAINASVRLGLYYNEELVSLMTFGKARYSKGVDYELLRFCSKLNTSVVGGASKLLKYFERNYQPRSIISYANRRWSTGKLYDNLGFEFQHCTKPNYFYFKSSGENLESRVKFQKHKLKGLLDDFNPELSETENMYNNGYRKIYDCGNKVYIKRY